MAYEGREVTRKVPARVIKVQGEKAIVEVLASECGGCPHKGKCGGELLSAKRRLEVENKGYSEGEIILVEEIVPSESQLILSYLLLFGLPLLLMITGAALSSKLWNEPFVGAVLGLGVSFLILRAIDFFLKRKGKLDKGK